nr:phage terminase small subunit P27 family [Jeotgalibacillus malaysiensis]
MAGRNKQPLSVIQGKGRSNHLTKDEIKKRQQQEEAVRGFTDNIEPPKYLTKRQKDEFERIAAELIRLNIFSNLDVDGLARYIDSKDEYIKTVKALRSMKPTIKETDEDGKVFVVQNEAYGKLGRSKNLLFNECKAAAADLGLSITSRLKLVIPQIAEPEEESDFDKKFGDV